jgi:hypothetical protein
LKSRALKNLRKNSAASPKFSFQKKVSGIDLNKRGLKRPSLIAQPITYCKIPILAATKHH